MQRKFLTNLALLLFLNVLVKPFYIFGIDVSVQNAVGSDEYGLFFVVLNFSFLFNIILDLGITQFNNRNIAQHSQLLNKHFSSIIVVKLALGVFYFIITFTGALIIGYDSARLYFLVFMALNQFLLMLIQYLRSNISGLLLFKTDSFMSVLDRILMIIICGALLWGGISEKAFQIEWFIYAQSFSYFITALIALMIVVKKSKFKKLNWNCLFILSIIKQLYPFSILVFLMTIASRIDTVVINIILPEPQSDIQAGIYAHAYRLLDAFSNYALLFSVLLLPLFSRMIKQKESIEHLAKLAFTLLFIASVIVSVNTCFYSYEIIDLLYNNHIQQSADLLEILMFAFIPIATTYVFGSLLTANGSLTKLNIVYSVSVLISLGLNIALIPLLQAKGSGIANLTAQLFAAISQVIIAVLLFRFRFNLRYLLLLVAFVVLVVVLNIVAQRIDYFWGAEFILISVVSFLIALIMRIIDLKEIINTIKNKN